MEREERWQGILAGNIAEVLDEVELLEQRLRTEKLRSRFQQSMKEKARQDRDRLKQENERLVIELDMAGEEIVGRVGAAKALKRIVEAWEGDKEGCSCIVYAEVTHFIGSQKPKTKEEVLGEILDRHYPDPLQVINPEVATAIIEEFNL